MMGHVRTCLDVKALSRKSGRRGEDGGHTGKIRVTPRAPGIERIPNHYCGQLVSPSDDKSIFHLLCARCSLADACHAVSPPLSLSSAALPGCVSTSHISHLICWPLVPAWPVVSETIPFSYLQRRETCTT